MAYIWRRKMKATYQQLLDTPHHIYIQDLEMMSLEAEYSKSRETGKK